MLAVGGANRKLPCRPEEEAVSQVPRWRSACGCLRCPGPSRGDGRRAASGLGQKRAQEHMWHGLHFDRCRTVGVEGEEADPGRGRP
ncbi:hypothetical protein NDU88_001293 [Pleurodeles waltl]|uniref:Uncharacterized protein n=1 Tax=Pleurodeles waltl TaxID=8319 RepID=A0AAV7P3I3_PLEWA|nr:hypothetical protein NDU88_001293 [Pleurodeles waltl]